MSNRKLNVWKSGVESESVSERKVDQKYKIESKKRTELAKYALRTEKKKNEQRK